MLKKILLTSSIALLCLAGIAHATFYPSGGGTYRLQTSIGTTNNVIVLSSFTEPVSNIPYTMSYLNSAIECGTIDPSTSKSEFISFTNIQQNADGTAYLMGVQRGLGRSYPYTSSTTLAEPHSGQAIFVLSDSPCLFQQYAAKSNNETITGQWTFNNFPITPSTPIASTTNAGFVQIATRQQVASGTPTTIGGSNAYLVIPSGYATSTSQVATSSVVVTGADGKIDQSFNSLTGSITAYASSSAPSGWFKCDGTAYATTSYPTLFSIIGYTYGSSTATNFRVPDLTGKTIVMASSTQIASSSDNRATIGAIGGNTLHTQTIAELAAHTHLPANGAAGFVTTNGAGTSGAPAAGNNGSTPAITGSSQPFDILDPYMVLNYIIKY